MTEPIKETGRTTRYERALEREQKKIDRHREKEEKKAATAELVNGLTGNGDGIRATDAIKAGQVKNGYYKDALQELLSSGDINKQEYNRAMSYVRNNKNVKYDIYDHLYSDTRDNVYGITAYTKGDSVTEIKRNVRAELKDQLSNEKISQKDYDRAYEITKTGSYPARFVGARETEFRGAARTQKYRNHLEEVKSEGPKFDAKLQAKMDLAGITTDKVYEIADRNGGDADATINYSYKRVQPGEKDAILAEFNNNEKGVEFTKQDINKIMKQAGYNVEHAVEVDQLAEDVARGALIGAPGSYFTATQHGVEPIVGTIVSGTIDQGQKFTIIGAGPAAGAAAAAIVSPIVQGTRVEDRAVPTNVPEGVKTWEKYSDYLNEYSTKEGAALGKQIARYFTDAEGNLNVTAMNKALSEAAGTDKSTSTPLNYEEAKALLMKLAGTPDLPVLEDIEIPEEEIKFVDYNLVKEENTIEVPVDTECYRVQKGDNWFEVAKAKYNVSDAEASKIARHIKEAAFNKMKEEGTLPAGVTSSRDAFFVRVGEELCLPKEIELNGKKYTYHKDAEVKAGEIGDDYKGSVDWTNPFSRKETYSKYGYKNVSEDGETKYYTSSDERDAALQEEIKKYDENTSVGITDLQ